MPLPGPHRTPTWTTTTATTTTSTRRENHHRDDDNEAATTRSFLEFSSFLSLHHPQGNDDIWAHILSYLALDDLLWKARHVNVALKRITEAYLKSSSSMPAWHGSFVAQRLAKAKSRTTAVNACVEHFLLLSCGPVRRLDTNIINYHNNVTRITTTMRHLVYLDLSGLVHWTGRTAQGTSLLQIIWQANPNLQTLNCSNCHRLEGSSLVEAWNHDNNPHVANLQHLILTNCYRVNADTIDSLVLHPTIRLRTLHMGGTASDIGKRSVLAVRPTEWHAFPALSLVESLDISGQRQLAGNLHTLCLLTRLQEFVASDCDRFVLTFSPAISVLLRQRIEQASLLLDNVNPSENVKQELLQIRNQLVSERDVDSFLNFSADEAFAQWRILNVNNRPCRQRHSTDLMWIALQSCRLVEVHLRGYESIQNADVQVLAATCGDTLRVLDLQGLPYLQDSGLQWIGRYCRALVDLDVSVCYALSDSGVTAVATSCRKLRCLRMNHVNMSDLSLQCIVLHLQHLLVLSVQGCSRLQHLDRLPPRLIELDTRATNLRLDNRILPPSLQIKDGRQQRHQSTTSHGQCSFARQSRRFTSSDISSQPMWSCLDCHLVSSRGVCGACSVKCHQGHRVHLVGLCKFYCDCAIGLGAAACQCVCLTGAQVVDYALV